MTNSRPLRVFLTVSHVSCAYMTLFAKEAQNDTDDVLIIDADVIPAHVVRWIQATADQHEWARIIDLSQRPASGPPLRPSLRKRLMRRSKELPVFRSVYKAMLRRHEARLHYRTLHRLRNELDQWTKNTPTVELFMHPKTRANESLAKLFPIASCTYFEHGLGDYQDLPHCNERSSTFLAVFGSAFDHFLARENRTGIDVRPLDTSHFHELADRTLDAAGFPWRVQPNGPPIVLVLLENMEMYEVDQRFWAAYIDAVLNTLGNTAGYHFILKPHPSQSRRSIELTLDHCERNGLSFTLMDNNGSQGASAEVLFTAIAGDVRHVFCLFSSACFYLSVLYPLDHITYHYSITFTERWIGNAPPMYKRHFRALEPLITEVFAARCLPY